MTLKTDQLCPQCSSALVWLDYDNLGRCPTHGDVVDSRPKEDGPHYIAPDAHEGMTHMLFVDAIIGLGFPHKDVGIQAGQEGMALFVGGHTHFGWAWSRHALENLHIEDLQEMYMGLKFYEVTH